MRPYRGNTPAKAGLNLQPVTLLHLAILSRIDSPALLPAQILAQGTAESVEQIAKLKTSDHAEETREAVFILTTPFETLRQLQDMNRETLRAAALQAVPAYSPEALAAAQQIISCYVGMGLVEIGREAIAKKTSIN